MTFRRAAVLGSVCDALPVVDALRAAGVEVDTWFLPAGCTGREAAVLAEMAATGPEWSSRFAGTGLVVTVFPDSEILSQAVVPYVLPYLPIGSVWLHMGYSTSDETDGLTVAAADYEISFVQAQPVRKKMHVAIARLNGPTDIHPTATMGGVRARPLELLTPRQSGPILPALERRVIEKNSPALSTHAGSLITRRDPGWDRVGAVRQMPRTAETGRLGACTNRGRESPPHRGCAAAAAPETDTPNRSQAVICGSSVRGGGAVHHPAAPP